MSLVGLNVLLKLLQLSLLYLSGQSLFLVVYRGRHVALLLEYIG